MDINISSMTKLDLYSNKIISDNLMYINRVHQAHSMGVDPIGVDLNVPK